MKKITFVNDSEPYLSAENLNQLQDNIEEEINKIPLDKLNEKQLKERVQFIKTLINERIQDCENYIKNFSNNS